MQENKIPVLCTRPLPEWLLEEAAASGIAIDCIFFIATEAIDTIDVQQEIENALLQSAVVVFTSMNAVEAVAAVADGQQPDWQVYCIGTATKRLVGEHFGEQCIAGTAPDAAALAHLMVEESGAEEVIFFCGDQRRDELPGILQEHDIDVNEIVVYQTMEVTHKIQQPYKGYLFFSPSAVRSFFKNNQLPDGAFAFAIGNTTAAAIKKFSSNRILISDEPGKESLVQQVILFFTEAN